METVTHPGLTTSNFVMAFDEECRDNFNPKDLERLEEIMTDLLPDEKVVHLHTLEADGDLFLARPAVLRKIPFEKEEGLIIRLGYIVRADLKNPKDSIHCGVWKVVSPESTVFRPYW
jgi:hypothetical protein